MSDPGHAEGTPKNHWDFRRVDSSCCVVTDASGTVYCERHGDLAAHYCQDYMRWTELPDYPGGPPKKDFGLKPAPQDSN